MRSECSRSPISPDEILLSGLHLLFIVFSYAVALSAQWYWGAALIVLHAVHEKLIGDCLLSLMQKNRGHSGPQDDFFFHLFCRLGKPQPRTVTSRIHLFIKGTILLIVVAKAVRALVA